MELISNLSEIKELDVVLRRAEMPSVTLFYYSEGVAIDTRGFRHVVEDAGYLQYLVNRTLVNPTVHLGDEWEIVISANKHV